MIHDAHFHAGDFSLLNYLCDRHIPGIINASSPQEYDLIKEKLPNDSKILISAGIHPWDAAKSAWEIMLPIMEKASIIGEIGLDNVWCDADQQLQYELFERSLAYASKTHKPVILHLKGREKEALPLLRSYRNTYFVHWYSCDDYLDEYIDLDCYFSIGPSVNKDKAVQCTAKKVPLKRLLLESDGLSALTWCEQQSVDITQYEAIMQRSISCVEAIRGQASIANCLNENLQRFITLARSN